MDCDPEWLGLPTQQALEKAFSRRDTQFIQVIENERVITNYQRRPAASSVFGVWVDDGVVKATNERPVGRHPTVVLHHPMFGDLDIDEEIADIIKALWDRGVTTTACCQDGEMLFDLERGVSITVTVESFSTFFSIMRQCMSPSSRRWHVTFANLDKPGTFPPNTNVAHNKIPNDVVAKMRDYLGVPTKTGDR